MSKHENHQKSPKSWFFPIFSSKVAFLAMMCVKVCLHMFLLQINQINKVKHSESVSWKQKTRFVCNFHWKSVFRWTQRSITQRRVITLGPIFKKMVLNWAQGLKEKSHEVSEWKNNNQLRYNKKCRGRAGSFRVKRSNLLSHNYGFWNMLTENRLLKFRLYLFSEPFFFVAYWSAVTGRD